MIPFLLLQILLSAGKAAVVVGGIIVLAKVWEKLRPVIIAKSKEGTEYFFGVSHSTKRKNMKPLTQDGIEGLEVEDNTCFGLCNKPSEVKTQIGTITEEKAAELINSLPKKKKAKVEKRKKS
ncbi:MAG: hypothetical protein AAB316_10255 [Bacteroidota bacterium]